MPDTPIVGNRQEQETFLEVHQHYTMAKQDLEVRIVDFDKKDVLFRSHIDATNWPYRSLVFDPRTFTALYEKTSRLLSNKPRGRMVPREGGDSLGARINNELLSFQWDDNERAEGIPMLAKWARMDLNARKYGASFGLCTWHWQRQILRKGLAEKPEGKSIVFYDGPNFKPWDNRDVLANPSYSTIQNWIQLRSYPTLQDLMDINEAARSKPIYKNLDMLRDQMRKDSKKGGDTRDTNWVSKNKAIKGLEDFLGRDELYRTVEVLTEYRPERWITFSPKHGVVLRDIPNPYNHGQIPVVMIKYYPIDDDLYGLSEIEPIERIQKAINGVVCQYLDAVNMSLYAPLKVRSTGGAVQMHTLEFGPGKKWLMSDPASDVLTHDQNITGVSEFSSTYRFLVSAMQEALGETSIGVSNLSPGSEGKTATEIRDLAIQRNARDTFHQMFLAEAIKKQMGFWHTMNQQFLFSNPKEHHKVVRIVGKDAMKYFQNVGLDGEGLTDEDVDTLSDESLADTVRPEDLAKPLFPVSVGGATIPKFSMEDDGQFGTLILEPQDLSGTYDYIPDVESMKLPDETQMLAARKQLIELTLNPVSTQLLGMDGYKLKVKEVIEDFFEQLGVKDADKYFERLQPGLGEGGMYGQEGAQGLPVDQGGGGGINPGILGLAGSGEQGMEGSSAPVFAGQA